jgi:hypothetical protein
MRLPSDEIQRARAVRLEDELAHRGIRLRRIGAELVGPCPVCGGTDRFSINVRKNVWNCRSCQRGGDVIDLVQHIDGIGFLEAVRVLAGEDRPDRPRHRHAQRPATAKPAYNTGNSKRSLELWRQAVPIVLTLADKYLIGTRKLDVPLELVVDGEVLRFHQNCPFGERLYPCLLALWRTIRGDDPVAITRTALTPDAQKIGRMSLGLTGGAAIKLTPDCDVTYGLTIGEGLETTLAAMIEGFQPTWALGNDGGIRRFPVLAGIDCLTIIVDNDDADQHGRRAGPDAAAECSARWTAAGREVRRVVPKLIGSDMADVIRRATQ